MAAMDQDYQFRRILQHRDSHKVEEYYAEKLLFLARNGFNVGTVDNGTTTAFHLASEYGNEALVRALLKQTREAVGIILRGDERDKDTALHLAALSGKVGVMLALLSVVPDENVDVRNGHGKTPLHYAMGKGNAEVAHCLILKGADLDAEDHTGAVPLHFAARGGKVEALDLLKEVHADKAMELPVNRTSLAGLTALHYAAWHDNVDAIKWLLNQGADSKRIDLVERGMPMHWAAMRGNKAAVEALIDVHVKNASTRVFVMMKPQRITVLELMESWGAKHVHAVLKVAEKNELLDARAFPEPVLVKYVIGYGDQNMNNNLKRSLEYGTYKKAGYRQSIQRLVDDKLLDWAAERGNKCSVELLVWLSHRYLSNNRAVGSPSSPLDAQIASCLQVALTQGQIGFATALAHHKLLKNKILELIKLIKMKTLTGEFEGRPLAYWIFRTGKTEAYEIFFKALDKNEWGNIINETDIYKERTALHWAVIAGEKDIVTKLCNVKECRANIPDSRDKPPYWYSLELEREDIARELARQEDVRADLDRLYRDRQVFVDALNAILVGSTLISSITFTSSLAPPLGYSFLYKATYYVPIQNPAVRVFWIFNSLSFFLAMASTLAAVRGVLPTPEIHILEVIRLTLPVSSSLLVCSILCVLIAFAAAGFSVLPQPVRFSQQMVVTTIFGGILCFIMLLWFLNGLHLLLPEEFQVYTRRALCLPRVPPKEQPVGTIPKMVTAQDASGSSRYFPYEAGTYHPIYPFLDDGLDELCLRVQSQAQMQ